MEHEIEQIVAGQRSQLLIRQGQVDDSPNGPHLLLPGSFNPLHAGHRGMAEQASRRTERCVAFELSVTNVEKASLSAREVSRRLTQFQAERVWLTRAPTFRRKAQLFPQSTFVIGADTAIRLFDPVYYESAMACRKAISEINDLECRFLVFGRLIEGRFVEPSDLPIPPECRPMFELVPSSQFRVDISSSEIRRNHPNV